MNFLLFLLVLVGVQVYDVQAQSSIGACQSDYSVYQQNPISTTLNSPQDNSLIIQNFVIQGFDAKICQLTVYIQANVSATVSVNINLVKGYALGTNQLSSQVATANISVSPSGNNYTAYTFAFNSTQTTPVQKGTRLAAVFESTGPVQFLSGQARLSDSNGGASIIGDYSGDIGNLQFTTYLAPGSYCLAQKGIQCFPGTQCINNNYTTYATCTAINYCAKSNICPANTTCSSFAYSYVCAATSINTAAGDIQNTRIFDQSYPNATYQAQVFVATGATIQVAIELAGYQSSLPSDTVVFTAQIVKTTTDGVPIPSAGLSPISQYTFGDILSATQKFSLPFLITLYSNASSGNVVALQLGNGGVVPRLIVTPQSSFSGTYNYFVLNSDTYGKYGTFGGISLVFATFNGPRPSTSGPNTGGSPGSGTGTPNSNGGSGSATGSNSGTATGSAPTSAPVPSSTNGGSGTATGMTSSAPTAAPTNPPNTNGGSTTGTATGMTSSAPTKTPTNPPNTNGGSATGTATGSGPTPDPTPSPSTNGMTGPAPTVTPTAPPGQTVTTGAASSNTGGQSATATGTATGPAPTFAPAPTSPPSPTTPTSSPVTQAPVVNISVTINVTITVTAENITSVDTKSIAAAFAARLNIPAGDVNVIIRLVGSKRAAEYEVIIIVKTTVTSASSPLANATAVQTQLAQEITAPNSSLNTAVTSSGSVSVQSVTVAAATVNNPVNTPTAAPSASPNNNTQQLTGRTNAGSFLQASVTLISLLCAFVLLM